jgi:hypothetical protein
MTATPGSGDPDPRSPTVSDDGTAAFAERYPLFNTPALRGAAPC